MDDTENKNGAPNAENSNNGLAVAGGAPGTTSSITSAITAHEQQTAAQIAAESKRDDVPSTPTWNTTITATIAKSPTQTPAGMELEEIQPIETETKQIGKEEGDICTKLDSMTTTVVLKIWHPCCHFSYIFEGKL